MGNATENNWSVNSEAAAIYAMCEYINKINFVY